MQTGMIFAIFNTGTVVNKGIKVNYKDVRKKLNGRECNHLLKNSKF